MYVSDNFLLCLFEAACGACMILGLLGALQAIPAVSLISDALKSSTRALGEFAVVLACIMPAVAMLLYTTSVADERLTLPMHLASFSLSSTILGML